MGLGTNLGGGIFADLSAIGGIAEAVVFDTTAGTTSTTNDPGLTSPFTNAENASDLRNFRLGLIVQENASGGPDDTGGGATLTFDFAKAVSLGELILLDSEIGTTASLFSGTTWVSSFTLTALNYSDTNNNVGNNEFTLLNFGGAIGDSLVVDFSRSGAVGEFEASVVPLPAGLPLLIGGVGALAWLKRRKKT